MDLLGLAAVLLVQSAPAASICVQHGAEGAPPEPQNQDLRHTPTAELLIQSGKDMGPVTVEKMQNWHQAQWKCPADEHPAASPAGHAWSDFIEVPNRGNQSRFLDIRRRFQSTLPITNIEPPAASPAGHVLLLKPLKRPAIESVGFNGTGDPVFAGV